MPWSAAATDGRSDTAQEQTMTDESIALRIERLMDEERDLRMREQSDRQDDDALAGDRTRVRQVEIELDRCWDLLRQRRALRGAGAGPHAAVARDAETGGGYLQ